LTLKPNSIAHLVFFFSSKRGHPNHIFLRLGLLYDDNVGLHSEFLRRTLSLTSFVFSSFYRRRSFSCGIRSCLFVLFFSAGSTFAKLEPLPSGPLQRVNVSACPRLFCEISYPYIPLFFRTFPFRLAFKSRLPPSPTPRWPPRFLVKSCLPLFSDPGSTCSLVVFILFERLSIFPLSHFAFSLLGFRSGRSITPLIRSRSYFCLRPVYDSALSPRRAHSSLFSRALGHSRNLWLR